jgi:Carboxypeptidase regulatory-like domain/TonB-dependent Receptor Plug Domain
MKRKVSWIHALSCKDNIASHSCRVNHGPLFALLIVLLLLPVFAFGQTDRATVTGTVVDPSGAVIAGAQILLTEAATGLKMTGSTNTSGLYTIPGLPVGTYTLSISSSGFSEYRQTGIILVATQTLKVNVSMVVGSSTQTVTVTGGAPLLDAETSSVSTTLEESAIRDLPLNANNGQDALNLALSVTPGVNGTNGTNQDFVSFFGAQALTNSVYLNGVESTSGLQGNSATPSRDALQEVQVMNNVADAEFGTGSAEIFQLKSGTNKFHGTLFEILQNEDLNANTWSNKYFTATCAGVASCLSKYARGRQRFNDYGGSAGGPIRKNRDFIFGDIEHYSATNLTTNPNSTTVPTTKMLTGDFSELLTGGTSQGNIPGANNPCTGQPYQYGQIFDPTTQQTVGGVTCATPFPGNIIPPGRLSTTAKNIAAIYAKDYVPTLTTRVYNNFPRLAAPNAAFYTKTSMDFKYDHTFSERHHLSTAFERATWSNPAGCNYLLDEGPLSSCFISKLPTNLFQITDNFSITPNILNSASFEFTEQINSQVPGVVTNNLSDYGFNVASTVFPVLNYGAAVNGVSAPSTTSSSVDDYYGYYGYHYQDTAYWNRGKHSVKFGGTLAARGLNSSFGGNVQTYTFANSTGGPTSPSVTPYVGSGFATMMLGDVQSASQQTNQSAYPRQKTMALFVQDNYKATPKLTLNLGLRWDFNFRGHEQAGRWQNFDLTAQNPAWGTYFGAWNFAQNSGQSFYLNEDYRQFAPRLGAAYQATSKIVARASYSLSYVPLSSLNSGYGPTYPANQNSLSFPISTVLNTVPGSVAFDWDSGYPATPTIGPQNNTNTSLGSSNAPLYISPNILHLGYTQNWYVGTQQELTKHTVLEFSYIANRGRNLQSSGQSFVQNYPNFSTYQPVLLAGNINTTVSNATQAAAIGVPYPYAGFSGPAYAAIAPFPQIARIGSKVITTGDPQYSAVSSYNAFVAEIKARGAHGLYADFNYVLAKVTGTVSTSNGNWGGSTTSYGQNLADYMDSKHWIQSNDQRQLLKGYLTYQLPFGRNQAWLSDASTLVNTFVGGWEIGFNALYGSGVPIGSVASTFQLPFFFGSDRAFLAAGQNVNSVRNLYQKGPLDLANLNDPVNNDFHTNLFVATTPQNPFGNTPYTWNHWRWNAQPAQENASLAKHFGFGREGQYQMAVSAQFFNIFNRHYYSAPTTSMSSSTFGQVTTVSGNRTGQLTARLQW